MELLEMYAKREGQQRSQITFLLDAGTKLNKLCEMLRDSAGEFKAEYEKAQQKVLNFDAVIIRQMCELRTLRPIVKQLRSAKVELQDRLGDALKKISEIEEKNAELNAVQVKENNELRGNVESMKVELESLREKLSKVKVTKPKRKKSKRGN